MREPAAALPWGIGAAVVLLLWYVARYGDTAGQFFHFDDFWLLGDASRVASPLDVFLPGSNAFVLYRPFSQIGYFWLLEQVFAHDPAPYHAVQLLAHALNAWLVYAVAAIVLDSRPLALGAALVYAAAPGHAIAVYWTALFSMTGVVPWYLLCLWWWLRRPAGTTRTAVALSLYLGALLAGEHGVTLPAALLFASLLIVGEPWRRALGSVAPLLVVAAFYVAFKLWYMRWGLEAHYPDPLLRAVIQHNYEPALAPLDSLRLLGFYVGCALGWLYVASSEAPRWYGVGITMLAIMALSAVKAPSSPTARRVLFGLLLFVTALGPVLLLPAHAYTYYVGIAGAGIAIAVMAAVAALPRARAAAAAGLVAAIVAGELLVGEPAVRANEDFRFLRDFQTAALRWIAGVDAAGRKAPPGAVVVVPHSLLSELVFARAEAHRLFLDAPYDVRLTKDLAGATLAENEVALRRPPLWTRGKDYPGRRPRWDWLRGGPR